MKLFTLGYQGVSLATYCQIAKQSGVSLVIDVREVAWSQRREFAKSSMQAALRENGMNYLHFKAAGNPSFIRKSSATMTECLTRFREHFDLQKDTAAELLGIIQEADRNGIACCLTCYEGNPKECHRLIVAESLRTLDRSIKIVNLPETDDVSKTHPLFKTADLDHVGDTINPQS